MKNIVAIIIPLYKELLSETEIISLRQCLDILSKHPVKFICSKNLNITHYQPLITGFKNKEFVYFDEECFNDIQGYNRLLLSPIFYKRFKLYQYILVYQLDAYVFRDELEYWCEFGYDYIGAPWFEEHCQAFIASKPIGVGNGGFSLRNVKSHLKVLHRFAYVESPAILFKKFLENITLRTFFQLIINLTTKNNTFHLFNTYKENEDNFWGLRVKEKFKWFKVAPPDVAIRFSIEVLAAHFINSVEDLPLGCHAWEKRDHQFWKQYIHGFI